MEIHDIIIGIVIVIILFVQFAVFFVACKKIRLFKRVIPDEQLFRMVKVYIPENQIKELSVKGILENEKKYSEVIVEDPQAYLELEEEGLSVEGEYGSDDWDEEVIGYDEDHPEAEIWITKENEEKKIQYQFLRSHEASGWTRIDY